MTDISVAVKLVADDFKATMIEEGFETFADMKKCYWWTSEDIKEEVDAILRLAESDWGIDIDGDVNNGGEYISYKSFMSKVYSAIKS